jgi:cytochrome c553
MRGLKIWAILSATISLLACEREVKPTSGLEWAYPKSEKTTFGQPLGPGTVHVPGSTVSLTREQFEHASGPIDWHPEDHPSAPAVVAVSQAGKSSPCAECHGFNGAGFPGAADLAGLPAEYIIEQVTAFRTGDRRSADPDQPDTAEMIKVAKTVTPAALKQAADYFAGLPRSRWLRVVESASVPKTTPDKYGWLDPAPGGGTEQVGDRVVELSNDLPLMFLDDDHVILTDYAPPGAIARGRRVAETGGGGGVSCHACHGPQLGGSGSAPPISGRPAGYVARTLWDIRVGARRGEAVAPMQAIANRLTASEIRDVSAYLASLHP